MTTPPAAREIEAAISQSLARMGLAGHVVLRGNIAELHGETGLRGVVAIDLGEWVEQWQLLPPEMRDKRVDTAASRLAQALRVSKPPTAPDSAMDAVGWLLGQRWRIGMVLAAVALGAWLHFAGFFSSATDGPEPEATAAPILAADPEVRAQQVCEAARARLYAGAALGVDVSGWVVELWLGKHGGEEPAQHPALTALLDGERLVAGAVAGPVGQIEGGRAQLVETAPGNLGVRSAVLRLSEAYAAAFMTSKERGAFIDFAERAADAVGADYGALYARCSHLRTRDVGAWYRGADEHAAAAIVLFAAGTYAEPAAFALAKLDVTEDGILPLLRRKAQRVERSSIDAVLKSAGGRVTRREVDGGVSGVTTFTFPLGGPTRAARAARALARSAQLPSR